MKKIISVFLTTLILLSVLSFAVFADGEEVYAYEDRKSVV